jgi:hypothetical protein
MNVDHLVGLELPGKSQDVRDRPALHNRDLGSCRLGSGLYRPVPARGKYEPCDQSEDCARRNDVQNTLLHSVTPVIRKFEMTARALTPEFG